MTERENILDRIKAANLVMSSVPKKTKDEFVQFAQDEFADNYGATLKYVWDFFKLSTTFLEGFDGKLDKILENIQNVQEEEVPKIRTLSGNNLKGGSNKHE